MADNIIDILIRAKDETQNAIKSATSGMGTVGKAALAGFATVGAAATAVAVKGIVDFTAFQGQMNEVFTLIPGISQQAMDDMTGQVKDFSKEFGVLPEKVVPALYQSLSAGVPPGNVFDFLEVAQKAAKGGVTELETAVDGLSSVVNAYGADALSAGKASDIMFTTVKLGKTNMEQLSRSLFNVIPTASALGVKFEDVGAAMATMTAQGTPTSVATTQLRQLFVELSKESSKTAKLFEQMAGKSFKEFIAGGGNVQQALQLLEKKAKDSGLGINDLFGSVEAGNAALQLTGKGTAKFSDSIKEMGNSAGATDKAFKQMETGLGPIFDKLKANAAVLSLEIGQKLAPVIEKSLSLAMAAWSTFVGSFTGEGSKMAEQLGDLMGPVIDLGARARGTFDSLQATWSTLVGAFTGEGSELADSLGENKELFITLGQTARTVFDWLAANVPNILSAVGDAFSTLVSTVQPFWDAIEGNKALLIGLGVYLGSVVLGAVVSLTAVVWGLVAGMVAAAAPIVLFVAVVASIAPALMYAWNHFETFRNVVQTVVDWIVNTAVPFIVDAFNSFVGFMQNTLLPAATNIWNAIFAVISFVAGLIMNVVERITNFISDNWNWISGLASAIWDQITLIISNAWQIISNLIQLFLNIISGNWSAAWDNIKNILSAVWNTIVGTIGNAARLVGNALMLIISFMANMVGGVLEKGLGLLRWFQGLPGKIIGAIAGLSLMLYDAGRRAINSLIDGIKNRIGGAIDAVKGALGSIRNLLPFSPAKEGPFSGRGYPLYSGQALAGSLAEGIDSRASAVRRAAASMLESANGALGSSRFGVAPGGAVPTGGAAPTAVPPALNINFKGNTDSAFATAFMKLVRSGAIQVSVG